jgi:hypothetical protein
MWTREVRCGAVQDNCGNNVIENPKFDATRSYQNISRNFLSIASRAAGYGEIYSYVENVLNTLHRDVDEKIKNSTDISANQSMEQETIAIQEKYSHITVLKKKVVKKKTSRRQRTWFHKLHGTAQRKRKQNIPEDNSHVLGRFESFTIFTELLMVNINIC